MSWKNVERNMVMFLDRMPDKAADLYLDAELPRAVENVHNILCRPDLLDDVVLKQYVWTYESIPNYSWMVLHAHHLAKRYNRSSFNSVDQDILDRIDKVHKSPVPHRLGGDRFTDVPLCVPEQYRAVAFENPPPRTEEDALYHRELEIEYLEYVSLADAVDIYKAYQDLKERAHMAGYLHD